MRRATLLIIPFLIALPVFAQQAGEKSEKAPAYTTTRDFKNRVFEVHNRSPRTILAAVQLLGSGFQGAAMNVNDELKTITVRDFPENLAAIDEAIRRLDQPVPATPEVEFHLYVLIGSNGAGDTEAPPELAPVVRQLQSTLRYANYGLMATAIHHTREGNGIESSGVADPKLVGMPTPRENPIIYSYSLRHIDLQGSGEAEAVDIGNFQFQMRLPLVVGTSTQYQSVGFETPVRVRTGEKVVVGTTTMGDKALIVVLTAGVGPRG